MRARIGDEGNGVLEEDFFFERVWEMLSYACRGADGVRCGITYPCP